MLRLPISTVCIELGNYPVWLTDQIKAPFPTFLNALEPEQVEAWIDLVEETGQTPEGLGMTAHFLFIGKKRVEQLAHRPQI